MNLKNFNEFTNESSSNEYSSDEKVNEVAGMAVLAGVGLIIASGAIFNWASHSWTKYMMERRYKPTGKTESVKLAGKDPKDDTSVEFEQFKDKESGATFWGVTYADKTVADEGYENVEYLLYDETGFDKIKKGMAEGKLFTAAPSKRWSKTPGRN